MQLASSDDLASTWLRLDVCVPPDADLQTVRFPAVWDLLKICQKQPEAARESRMQAYLTSRAS